MPTLRYTSSTDTKSSAWCKMKAICCSLNRDCYISKILRLPNSQTYRDFLTQNGPVSRVQVKTGACIVRLPRSRETSAQIQA
jgi:hypothetical protein